LDSIDLIIMKPKALRKKIRRLEARQQKDARKLAKLRQKLASAKAGEKSTAGETAKPAAGGKRRPAKKAKRKLNLSPERRAQLAAAMKARWAAKRAAAAATSEKTPAAKDFTIGGTPQGK
jgi:hypothetical protein